MKEVKFNQKNICLAIFTFCFIMLNVYITIKLLKSEETKDQLTRLHVVANSNSIQDQLVKLKIYESVNDYIKSLNIDNTASSKETLNILEKNTNDIAKITNKVLNENNMDYSSSIDIGKIYYDKKDSIELTMPQGCYNSIRINLGNAEGKNIWSLIFPNEDSIKNISNLDSILPGISNIYNNENVPNKDYSFKILEILNEL